MKIAAWKMDRGVVPRSDQRCCRDRYSWCSFLSDFIDPDAVECDELKPEPGRSNDKTPYVVWRNNVMALALMKRTPKYSGEREFMDSTKDSDFCWEFQVDEE